MNNKKKGYGFFLRGKEEPKMKFSGVEESNEEVNNRDLHVTNQHDHKVQVNRSVMNMSIASKMKESDEMCKVLEEDSTAYEYDSIYDKKISSARDSGKTRNTAELLNSKPKYIQNMIKSANKRNLEHEIVKEKNESRKREAEEREGEKKEKFITKAYEEKLKDSKKELLKQQIEEKYDKQNQIDEEIGVHGFYSNLLTTNSAYAGGLRLEGNSNAEELAEKRKKEYVEKIAKKIGLSKEKDKEEQKMNLDKKQPILNERDEQIANIRKKIEIEEKLKKEVVLKDEKPLNDRAEDARKRLLERKRKREEEREEGKCEEVK